MLVTEWFWKAADQPAAPVLNVSELALLIVLADGQVRQGERDAERQRATLVRALYETVCGGAQYTLLDGRVQEVRR